MITVASGMQRVGCLNTGRNKPKSLKWAEIGIPSNAQSYVWISYIIDDDLNCQSRCSKLKNSQCSINMRGEHCCFFKILYVTSLVLRWTLERLGRLAFYRGAVKVHLSATRPTLVEASSGFSVRSYYLFTWWHPPPHPPQIRLTCSSEIPALRGV